MPYTINLSNGNLLTIISDDTLDTSTSLTLLGRSFVGYGEIVAEDLVYLLENFANTTPPSNPLAGQLWYNTSSGVMNYYSGSSWQPVGGASTGITITQTTADNTGLVFYDPSAPANSRYYRIRVRDDGMYDGHLVIESLNDNNTINTVVFDTDSSGDVKVANLAVSGTTSLSTATGVTVADSDNSTNLATTFYVRRTSRIMLSGNLNMYVSPTGSDSNSGLSSGTPFQTLQHAVAVAQHRYDCQGFNVMVNLAAGTYTTGASVSYPITGPGNIFFIGNNSNPASVIVNLAAPGNCFAASFGASIHVQGMTLGAPSGSNAIGAVGGDCLGASLGGAITFQNIIFGTTQRAHIETGIGGYIVASGNYTISGGAFAHWIAGAASGVSVSLVTVTLTGTPAFTYFAWAEGGGYMYLPSITWSPSSDPRATGTRYLAGHGGSIGTNGGGANYLPGNSPGDSTTGYYT